MWPKISNLRDFNKDFPKWKPQPLGKLVPALNASGLDLVQKMLAYRPSNRISALDAMNHPFLRNIWVDYYRGISFRYVNNYAIYHRGSLFTHSRTFFTQSHKLRKNMVIKRANKTSSTGTSECSVTGQMRDFFSGNQMTLLPFLIIFQEGQKRRIILKWECVKWVYMNSYEWNYHWNLIKTIFCHLCRLENLKFIIKKVQILSFTIRNRRVYDIGNISENIPHEYYNPVEITGKRWEISQFFDIISSSLRNRGHNIIGNPWV